MPSYGIIITKYGNIPNGILIKGWIIHNATRQTKRGILNDLSLSYNVNVGYNIIQ